MTNATRQALIKTYESLRRAGWDQAGSRPVSREIEERQEDLQEPNQVTPHTTAFNYVVASLEELCDEEGPKLRPETIVEWIDRHGGFDSEAELTAYAKQMKARQYARQLTYEDEETGLEIKRLWVFRDPVTQERYYNDILQLPEDRRRRLIIQYSHFLDQLRTVRRAMADHIAGQEFFPFYVEEEQECIRNSLRQAALIQELASTALGEPIVSSCP